MFALSAASPAYAVDCDLSSVPADAAPSPDKIFCPLIKVINVGIALGGVVFLIFILIGAIKLAVSLGDPKGFQGASDTWTYAVIGVFVVFGAFMLVGIVDRMFGLGIGDSLNLVDQATSAWSRFLRNSLGVTWRQ